MKKSHLLCLFLLVSTISFSQDKIGIVHYGEIQSMGMGAPIGPDYNALLVFDNNRSLYTTRKDSLEGRHIREQKKYTKSSGGSHSQTNSTNEVGFLFYHDLQELHLYSRDIGYNFVKEKTPNLRWKITNETKEIGKFTAYKATAQFRGRDYTAWFTTEIPLPFGPWKLQGLPGLILEAYDTNKEIYWYFKGLKYPSSDHHLLKKIKNKKNWQTLESHRLKVLKALKEARIAGRMGAESAGVSIKENSEVDFLRFFIENFTEK